MANVIKNMGRYGTSEREDSVSNGHGCMVHPPWTTLTEEKINIYIKNLASPSDT